MREWIGLYLIGLLVSPVVLGYRQNRPYGDEYAIALFWPLVLLSLLLRWLWDTLENFGKWLATPPAPTPVEHTVYYDHFGRIVETIRFK